MNPKEDKILKHKEGEIIILADYPYAEMATQIYGILKDRKGMEQLMEPDPKELYLNRFANGELDNDIKQNVRDKRVFLIKSPYTIREEKKDDFSKENFRLEDYCYDSNAFVMRVAFLNDALKRASAKDITDIIPHLPYQRQDRRAIREEKEEHKDRKTRSSVGIRVVADILQMKADRFITFDPHFKQIEAVFDKPFDCLNSNILFAEYIHDVMQKEKISKEDVYIMGPDVGSTETVHRLAKMVGTYLFGIIDKERTGPGKISEKPSLVIGPSAKGKHVFIRDDMIDTGGTLVNASNALKKDDGAASVTACIFHPILCKNAIERISNSGLKLVTSNTIPIPNVKNYPNIHQIDIAPITAEAIYSICTGRELSSFFEDFNRYMERKREVSSP